MRILIVEDSVRLARSLKLGLRKAGHAVDVTHDGESGYSYARLNPYDAIVLDLMLPKMDGIEVLRKLRQEAKKDTLVLVLTARDQVDDRVRGLREGADDYLVKPFAFEELLARIDALGRRANGSTNPVIEVGDLAIDTRARRVTQGSKVVDLTRREYALLTYLATRRGETVSRIEIEDHLYDEDTFPMSNAVPAAICTLRSRLAAAGATDLIHTRRGLGYVLETPR